MPRMPKRIKFRKQMRGKLKGNATRGNFVAFGDYGLQALERHWVSARQIEAGRIAAQHFLRRQGKVYIRVFPDLVEKEAIVCRPDDYDRALRTQADGKDWTQRFIRTPEHIDVVFAVIKQVTQKRQSGQGRWQFGRHQRSP